jgi:hypothetical protein
MGGTVFRLLHGSFSRGKVITLLSAKEIQNAAGVRVFFAGGDRLYAMGKALFL